MHERDHSMDPSNRLVPPDALVTISRDGTVLYQLNSLPKHIPRNITEVSRKQANHQQCIRNG